MHYTETENLQTYNLQTYKTIFQMVHERLKNSINNIIYYNI